MYFKRLNRNFSVFNPIPSAACLFEQQILSISSFNSNYEISIFKVPTKLKFKKNINSLLTKSDYNSIIMDNLKGNKQLLNALII